MQEFSFQVFEAFTAATIIYIVINIIVTFGMREARAPRGRARLIGAKPRGGHALRRSMFSNFDFDVIIRSLPYLFFDGMTLHAHADRARDHRRHRLRHAAGDDAAVRLCAALGAGGRLREPDALGAAACW